jgi:hypothetical protein
MSGLQETFYIMGIVYMAITFLILIALVVVAFIIKSKINKIHATIEEKINMVTGLAERGGELSAMATSAVLKQAKKAFQKARK